MIKNGQEANETNFNNAFVSRTADTSTTGKLALNNTSDANSGGTIANTQRAINETFDAVGITGEGDATRKQYSSSNYVSAGDSHKVAIGKLDAQAKAQSQTPSNVSSVSGTLPVANGGTGQTTKASAYDALSPNTTEGDLEVRGSSNTQRLGIGTTGQVLTVDTTVSGKTKWATPANPNVSNASGTLPVVNGGTGQTTASSAFAGLSPTTTKGDLIVNNARLGVGTDAQVLVADSTTTLGVKWGAAASTNPNVSNATGTLPIANGGTGQTTKAAAFNGLSPLTTAGDLIYSDGTNNTRLGVGSTGQYLTVSGGVPAWATVTPGGVGQFYYASYYMNTAQNFALGDVIKWDTKWDANSDLFNMYTPSTGLFKTPVAGLWCLMIGLYPSGGGTNFLIKVNGVNSRILASASGGAFNNGSRALVLPANATVGVYAFAGATGTIAGKDATNGVANEATFYRLDR